MATQLTLDFISKPQRKHKPIIQKESWLDVSDIARGIGFTTAVQISVALNDSLQPLQSEINGDYDQRLYDALWQAYFRLLLDQGRSVTFNFFFTRKDGRTEDVSDVSLRMRVESREEAVLLGLLKEFSEST